MKTTRISKIAATFALAVALGAPLAPAAAAPADGAAHAAAGKDDKCRLIKNKKKRQKCFAKHEKKHGANHQ